jgi:hypothetical protein
MKIPCRDSVPLVVSKCVVTGEHAQAADTLSLVFMTICDDEHPS